MTERLNNEQINRRIIDANSDLQRYLNLAPGLSKPTLSRPKAANGYSQNPNSPARFLKPTLNP